MEKKEMEYLYRDGDSFYFMDPETFEQVPVGLELMEKLLPFLKENTVCSFKISGDEVLTVSLPDFMVFEVVEQSSNRLAVRAIEQGTRPDDE